MRTITHGIAYKAGRVKRDKPMTSCEDCRGHGFLLIITKPIHIERCDNCDRFASDSEAVQFVAKLAWRERPKQRRAA